MTEPVVERLLQKIQASTSVLSISQLETMNPDTSRRTIQRHLARLVERGEIVATGKGPSRRYLAPMDLTEQRPTLAGSDAFPKAIPLSADSNDVLKYVEQPIQARRPVGYKDDFLSAYEPNKTRYLSESLCRQ